MYIAVNVIIITKNTTNSLGRLGYCPACKYEYLSLAVDLLGTHIWKKIKRFLFDFNACVSSVLWCTMRFRCPAIGVSRVFVLDARSPTPARQLRRPYKCHMYMHHNNALGNVLARHFAVWGRKGFFYTVFIFQYRFTFPVQTFSDYDDFDNRACTENILKV